MPTTEPVQETERHDPVSQTNDNAAETAGNINLSTTTTNTTSHATTNNNQTNSTVRTYASAVNETFPTKKQAIIVEVDNETTYTDTVKAIAAIIQGKNILFASKISNNRVCLYLKDIPLVNKITAEHPTITVNGKIFKLRRYINASKRLIISNVSPDIPHEIIKNLLLQNNIELTSAVAFLRAGLREQDLSHICSFRRHVYIKVADEQVHKIPDSLLVEYDGEKSRIFLTIDGERSKENEKNIHIATTTDGRSDKEEQLAEVKATPNKTLTPLIIKRADSHTRLEVFYLPESPKSPQKRRKEKSPDSQVLQPTYTASMEPTTTKQPKINQIENMKKKDKALLPFQNMINEQHRTAGMLNIEQLSMLLQESKKTESVTKVINKLGLMNVPVSNILTQLNVIYEATDERSLKITITKFTKKLNDELQRINNQNHDDKNSAVEH